MEIYTLTSTHFSWLECLHAWIFLASLRKRWETSDSVFILFSVIIHMFLLTLLTITGCFWKNGQIHIRIFINRIVWEDWGHCHQNGISRPERTWKSKCLLIDRTNSIQTVISWRICFLEHDSIFGFLNSTFSYYFITKWRTNTFQRQQHIQIKVMQQYLAATAEVQT